MHDDDEHQENQQAHIMAHGLSFVHMIVFCSYVWYKQDKSKLQVDCCCLSHVHFPKYIPTIKKCIHIQQYAPIQKELKSKKPVACPTMRTYPKVRSYPKMWSYLKTAFPASLGQHCVTSSEAYASLVRHLPRHWVLKLRSYSALRSSPHARQRQKSI